MNRADIGQAVAISPRARQERLRLYRGMRARVFAPGPRFGLCSLRVGDEVVTGVSIRDLTRARPGVHT